MCLHVSCKCIAYVTCNFNCRVETEGLLKVAEAVKVVIYWKRCGISMLLSQTTEGNIWYINLRHF